MNTRSALTAMTIMALTTTASFAQDVPAAVEARQGQFKLMALNVGVLGNMARGNTAYDANQATAAAANLVAVSMLDQSFHWPEGTDEMSIEGTRALPAIWENTADFGMKWQAFGAAATGLAAEAGNGLDAMRAALGPVGGTCGACHDAYRAPQ
ncbi:cytochrome c [Rhodobacterales bacterium LSUCC0031]|nr:cytochrome c [Rhodobacterales bacterium LSUCC0031]